MAVGIAAIEGPGLGKSPFEGAAIEGDQGVGALPVREEALTAFPGHGADANGRLLQAAVEQHNRAAMGAADRLDLLVIGLGRGHQNQQAGRGGLLALLQAFLVTEAGLAGGQFGPIPLG